MNFCRWMIACLMIGGAAPALRADPFELSETVANETPSAKGGSPLTIDLGRDENLSFVWIAPMNIWVGKYEVTNGQYQRYDASHDSTNYVGRELNDDLQPVVRVSWEDANNYCGWLNRHFGSQIPTGYTFRLPTEKEWETFVRCGDPCVFPWGDQWPPPNEFNYRGDEGSGFLYRLFQREQFIHGHNDGFIVSCPVLQSGRNSWGLYGVGGNVWEWCQDWFDTAQRTRVIRGAAWNNYQKEIIAISHRGDAPPEWNNEVIGIRVVIGPLLP